MKPLFIHIPKTGGMSIRHGLKGRVILASKPNLPTEYAAKVKQAMDDIGEHHGYEHARWRDVREQVRETHPALAIVRNPWARTVSRYTFAVVTGHPSGRLSFREFLNERHRYADRPYFWHRGIYGWYQQKCYVQDATGALQADCLRLESDDVQAYFGLSGPLRRRNVSNRGEDYRYFYGPDEHAIVSEWYAEDIEFFGFCFDGPATRNIWT